jgi:serine/threonine protein kinase
MASSPDSFHPGLYSGPISFEASNGVDASDPSLTRTTEIGPYQLLRLVGRGGMGLVYEARDTRLQRRVAIKVMLEPAPQDSRGERFLREATSTARLNHPNIVQVHDVGRAFGRDYIVMPFVEGITLAEALRSRVFSFKDMATILEKVATAVHFAHTNGIIHRDLKPANIMLAGRTASGSSLSGPEALPIESHVPMVMDFGLAKDLAHNHQLSRSGQAMGTPVYMPPEQARGNVSGIGPYSDVYSLGATLYEMLTGRPPFSGDSPIQIMEALQTDDPVAPRVMSPRVPRDLETICLKCLEKTPEKRYASAEALAADLRAFIAGDAITARPRSWVNHVWRSCRKRPTLSVGVVMGAAGLTVALILMFQNEQTKRQALVNRENERTLARERALNAALKRLEAAHTHLKLAGGVESANDKTLKYAIEECEGALRENPTLSEAHALMLKLYKIQYDRFIARKDWKNAWDAFYALGNHGFPKGEHKSLGAELTQLEKKHSDFTARRLRDIFEDAKSRDRRMIPAARAIAELTSMRSDIVCQELATQTQSRFPECRLLALEAMIWQDCEPYLPWIEKWIHAMDPNGEANTEAIQHAAIRLICLKDNSKEPAFFNALVRRLQKEPDLFNSTLFQAIQADYIPYMKSRSKEFNLKALLPDGKQ